MLGREKWFPRFAEVPGVRYVPPDNLDLSSLEGRGMLPRVRRHNEGGRSYQSITWVYKDVTTSSSPAADWRTTKLPGESEPRMLVRQTYETLELPGVLSDYHFALQNGHDSLRKYISTESWVLSDIERFCLLNIQLIDQHPAAITFEMPEGDHYFGVSAFRTLCNLYQREGYLRDALIIAQMGERFGFPKEEADELAARITALETEGDGV